MADVDGKVADGRALRRMETHEQLFQASVRVITARGYDGTTMDEIAAEAGVSRRTAFNHFPAKSDIADEWAARRGERALEAIGRAGSPARSGPDRVRVYFHELALMTERDWEETRQMTAGWLRGHGMPGHRSMLPPEPYTWLDGWLAGRPAGSVPQEVCDPKLATEVLYDVFRGALLRRLSSPAPRGGHFAAEVDAAVLLVLIGLGYRPGCAK